MDLKPLKKLPEYLQSLSTSVLNEVYPQLRHEVYCFCLNKYKLKPVSLIFGIILSLTSCQKESRSILSVTDIHFTPFTDSLTVSQLVHAPYKHWDTIFSLTQNKKVTRYGEETNPVLFEMLRNSMSEKKSGISAVLFTGDILAHEFNELFYQFTGISDKAIRDKFIYNTVGYVSMKLRQTFPETPIYFSLGNNDSYNGDYAIIDNGQFLQNTSELFFKNFIHPGKDTTTFNDEKMDFLKTYSKHGYYNISFPAINNCRIIGLNTIFFSTNYAADSLTPSPGSEQLVWFEKQLSNAEKTSEKIWLLLHIPPGVNVYSTQNNSSISNVKVSLQWREPYNEKFIELFQKYHKTITASFAGHTHMDDFRLIYTPDSLNRKPVGFIHITPSVSPVFGNNPVFEIIKVNPENGSLTDAVAYYVNLNDSLPEFKEEYLYTSAYSVPPDLLGLDSLYPDLLTSKKKLANYTKYYPVSSTESDITNDWQWYWCGIGNLTKDDYSSALKQFQK